MKDSADVQRKTSPTVAIVGAGIAGMCMAIRLKRAGIDSFTIYEKADRVGGTWRENRYPGAACDIPSHLYSFSFEPNPDFSRKYSGQPEIERYLQRCAEKYGLLAHVRFGTEIAEATFDETRGTWLLRTQAGEELEANVLVSGVGQLNRPVTPSLPGLGEFHGSTVHSAVWKEGLKLAGERVAIVGNGASAIQIIPKLASDVQSLTIFQRTPNWIVPRGDRAYGAFERWIFRHVPFVLFLYRAFIYWLHEARFFGLLSDTWLSRYLSWAATAYMMRQITRPELQKVLTPDYPIGCKRVLVSDDYYSTLERSNVSVVAEGIERVTPEGLVTSSGATHAADTIVFATGFETTTFLAPMQITGRGGRRLHDAWKDGAEAHLGVAVAGFPNLFLLYGPNTNLGHNSIIFMIECQTRYVLCCIVALRDRRLTWIDVKPEAMALFNAELQQDLARTAWGAGCTSWYKTATGKVTNNWSGFTVQYWWRTRRPNWGAFEERA